MNSRWLGGTLTNWKTISGSISRLRKLEEMLSSNEAQAYTKKERLELQRERDKLDRALGGIKDMGGLPDLLFVIDTNKEDIAIKEARRLNVPVAAVVDTNCTMATVLANPCVMVDNSSSSSCPCPDKKVIPKTGAPRYSRGEALAAK